MSLNKNKTDWWQKGVIYQIYPRSYLDTSGNGIGDLQGVIQKLDYLQNLGIDAIWLNPFFISPMEDFGYDVADYLSVDPLFGTNSDMLELIQQAHRRGIKVIFDLVLNHTSSEHPWFIESRSSTTNPRRNWYNWQEKKPNNWQSIFGGSGWAKCEITGQFYYHSFLASQPDLNLANPEVVEAICQIITHYLELGVDGFRLDAVNNLFEDESLEDNLRQEDTKENLLNSFSNRINTFDHQENFVFLDKVKRLLNKYEGRVLIGEVNKNGPDKKAWQKYYGYNGYEGLDLIFNFDLLYKYFDAELIKKAIAETNKLNNNQYPSFALSSHDQVRFPSRLSQEPLSKDQQIAKIKLLATFLLTVRGTPFIYYGDELGLAEYKELAKSQIKDPWAIKNNYQVTTRDGCRTPMLWDNEAQAGFSNNPATWLPIHENYQELSVTTQPTNPNSILNHYKKLIQIRKSYLALQLGEIELIEAGKEVVKYKRKYKNQAIIIVLNFGLEVIKVDLEECEVIFSNLVKGGSVEEFGFLVFSQN